MGSAIPMGRYHHKGVDCSGLVKVTFFASALILPRNAPTKPGVAHSR